MKQMKLTLMSIITVFLVACAFSSASASTSAYSYAVIDYDSFDISFTGDGSYNFNSFAAYAETTNESQSDPSQARIQTSAVDAWGETIIDETTVEYNDLYTHSYIESPMAYDYAYARTMLEGTYAVRTAGTLNLYVEYYLGIEGDADAGDIAGAWASVLLSANEVETGDDLGFTYYNGLDYDDEPPWRSLEIALDLEAGDEVAFSIMGESYADAGPVPVPGTGLLLGAGLLGLAALRRQN